MLEDGPCGPNGSRQNREGDQDGLEEGGDVSLYGVDWEDMEDECQEIGLVTIRFFFELLFSYDSLQFPSMFPLLTYFQSFFSLSADYLRYSR